MAVAVSCSTEHEPRATLVEAFEVPSSGAAVVLHYTGGGCEDGVDHVDVQEGDKRVVVTLWLRAQVSGDCDDYGERATHEVELERTVGSRILLDGVCVAHFLPENCPDGAAATPRPVLP